MKNILWGVLMMTACLSCSQQKYVVTNIDAQRHPIVAGNYINSDTKMKSLVANYKQKLDLEMNQVIGVSSQDMTYGRPESLLTNLTSDVMLLHANAYTKGNCDLALMNVHGHRANLAKGDITVGNMFEIYSFENALVILKLKGEDLLEAFKSYAKMGGAGISSTAKLHIKNQKLVSATVGGLPIEKEKVYTVATLDYLADGNDGLEVLKKRISIENPNLVLRDAMMQYVKEQTAQGKEISSVLDGRITIE